MSVAMLPHMLELGLQPHQKQISQQKSQINHMGAAESSTTIVTAC